jgi:UDP-glucose 4-epimerase
MRLTRKLFLMTPFVVLTFTHAIPQGDLMSSLATFYRDVPVLVTGGCGFIGSHLAQKLVALGAKVTILDDLSTGSLENITSFKDHITFIHASIVDPQVCHQAVQGQQIIFHQAAYISVPGSVLAPATCHEVNVNGTFHLLEAARAHGVQRFVYASSASVYGQKEGICSEESQPAPISPYGASKLIKEVYAQQYSRTYGLHTTGLRYFNVYGPRQNPHAAYSAAIAKFSFQMEHNLPITIFGDGMQTRDFIYVDEVVDANLIVAAADPASTSGAIFNIATGSSVTLLTMIEQLKHKYPAYHGSVEFHPARPGDVKHSGADCYKYKQLRTLVLEAPAQEHPA